MKKYQKPSMVIVTIATHKMLCGSAGTLTNEYSGGAQLSRQFDGWDEDE